MPHSAHLAALICFVSLRALSQTQIPAQTTNGACSPIFNGNNNTMTCTTVPGYRSFSVGSAMNAVSILKPFAGSPVGFNQVGKTREIIQFEGNVEAVFRLAKLNIIRDSNVDRLDESDDFGGSHGEGVDCGAKNPSVLEALKAAFAAIGYPCRVVTSWPTHPPYPPYDVYVRIGSRLTD